jgi:hypothetical protein
MKAYFHRCEGTEQEAWASSVRTASTRLPRVVDRSLTRMPTSDGDEWILQLVASFGTITAIVSYCPWCGSKLTID